MAPLTSEELPVYLEHYRTETTRDSDSPERFLRKLYGNERIITEEAKHFHKVTLPKGVEAWAAANDLTNDNYFAIPLGSARTIPVSDSDVDLLVITDNEWHSKPENSSSELKLHVESGDVSVDAINVQQSNIISLLTHMADTDAMAPNSIKNLNYEDKQLSVIAELILTPDELIFGNVEIARKMRLDALEFISKHCDQQEFWDKGINRYLSKYIIGWPNIELGTEGRTKRKKRFHSLVNTIVDKLNTKELGLGDKWKDNWLSFLREMSVPPFEVYRKRLLETKGALEIGQTRFK